MCAKHGSQDAVRFSHLWMCLCGPSECGWVRPPLWPRRRQAVEMIRAMVGDRCGHVNINIHFGRGQRAYCVLSIQFNSVFDWHMVQEGVSTHS